jgi:flagellar hook protein FlgE
VTQRLAHLSDLHFGEADGASIASLGDALRAAAPDALVVSGDLTRRARSVEFAAAAKFLGGFGVPTGLTLYSGSEYSVRDLSQDGVPLGSFSGVTIRENGDVAVNYDNGQTRVVARVPIVAFNDPDKLQRLDGQAFLRTVESGEARVTDAASNGVGKLVTGSVERSNVDIAAEFSKLILAQRAYTSNTRIVTAADEMLQDTINMKR